MRLGFCDRQLREDSKAELYLSLLCFGVGLWPQEAGDIISMTSRLECWCRQSGEVMEEWWCKWNGRVNRMIEE